jgi:hypothetical protein
MRFLVKKQKKGGIFPKRVENSRLMVYIYTKINECKALFRRVHSGLF